MKKKTPVTILIILVVILGGIIVWQYLNSRSESIEYINPSTENKIDDPAKKTDVVNNVEEKNETNLPIEAVKKITIPAKDEETFKNIFTYEVPLSKILDKNWVWVEAINYDESIFTAKKSSAFSLTFKKDGTFSGTTDCNSISGKYTARGSTLTFSSVSQTKMYCEGSEEIKFNTYLGQVNNFMFNGNDNLVLNFEFNSGSMIFK